MPRSRHRLVGRRTSALPSGRPPGRCTGREAAGPVPGPQRRGPAVPANSCAETTAPPAAPSAAAGPVPPVADVTPSVRALLHTARAALGMELTFLAAVQDGDQTFTDVDAAPGSAVVPVPEGTVLPVSDSYCGLMVTGRIQASVPGVAGHPVLRGMPVTAAHRVAAYCGVPVHLPDGSLHGTLCGLDGAAGHAPSVGQLEALRTIAGLIGVRIAEERSAVAQRTARAGSLRSTVDGPRTHHGAAADRRAAQRHGRGLRGAVALRRRPAGAGVRRGARPPRRRGARAGRSALRAPPAAPDAGRHLPVGQPVTAGRSPGRCSGSRATSVPCSSPRASRTPVSSASAPPRRARRAGLPPRTARAAGGGAGAARPRSGR